MDDVTVQGRRNSAMKNVKMLVVPALLILCVELTPITTMLGNQTQSPVVTAQNLLQQSDISQFMDKPATNDQDARRF